MFAQSRCIHSLAFNRTSCSAYTAIQRSTRDLNRNSSSRAVVCLAKSTSSEDDGESSRIKRPKHTVAADCSGQGSSADAGQYKSPGGSSRASADGSPAGSKRHGTAASRADHSESGRAGQPGSAANRPAQRSSGNSQQGSSRPAGETGRGGRGERGGRSGGRGRGRGRGRASGRGTQMLGTSGGNKGFQPKQLTAAIKAAHSPEQMLHLLQQYSRNLDHIHLSAAYTHSVKLCRQGVILQHQPAAVQQLLQLLHGLAGQLQQQCGARELANIIWSCGRLSNADTVKLTLPAFLQDSKLQQAKPQEVSNTLWAAATLELQLTPQQVQLLLQRFAAVVQQAEPQHVANTLWALDNMQHQVPDQQLQLLLQQFQEVLPQATPQAVSNILWALATMQQQVPQRQLQQMLQRFQEVLPQATPQAVANTLWAVATLQQQVPQQQLLHMLHQFQEVLPQANPQAVGNTLWACGKLQYAPQKLLSALEQQPQQLQAVLAAATPQNLTNMACACGQLGYRGKLLPKALLQQAVRLLQDSCDMQHFKLQNICNLCWSAAVLDMQQCISQLLQLAASSSQLWGTAQSENLQQLYQVHLWLLDSQLPAPGQGLSGALSQQQLERCRASWEQRLAVSCQAASSDLQRAVHVALQQLPRTLWLQQPAAEQVTADGLFSIDIAATTASGVKVAIEVDGPSHLMQPGNTLEGGTMFRNRALATRGYVVISIPYWEWDPLQGPEQKQQYLLTKLQPALQPSSTAAAAGKQPPQQGASTAAMLPAPAPAVRKRRVRPRGTVM